MYSRKKVIFDIEDDLFFAFYALKSLLYVAKKLLTLLIVRLVKNNRLSEIYEKVC